MNTLSKSEQAMNKLNMKKQTMTVPEMSKILGISSVKGYELARQESFTAAIKVGKRIIIVADAFDEWLLNSAKNRLEINPTGR